MRATLFTVLLKLQVSVRGKSLTHAEHGLILLFNIDLSHCDGTVDEEQKRIEWRGDAKRMVVIAGDAKDQM